MIPVKQSKLYAKDGIHNGNCFAACLASLLEVPLWMVPPFDDMFGRSDWRPRVDEWIMRMFSMKLLRWDVGDELEEFPEFYIASGLSQRGVQHSVIYSNGVMVHDPHFSDSGIAKVDWIWYLAPAE